MEGEPVVIAVVNHKGGTAKTTTAVNLAAALAKGDSEMGIRPRRVLLVDLDPRGNVATTFGIDKRSLGPTMNELFKGGADEAPVPLERCLLNPAQLTVAMRESWRRHNPERKRGAPKTIEVRNLWVLPADLDLSGVEIDLATRIGREHRLRLALLQARGRFDVVIVDTPPSLGLLTINSLSAAEWVMIPIQAEFYSLEGMGQLLAMIKDVQRTINPNLKMFGIAMTLVQGNSKLGEKVAERARGYFGDRVFETEIPRLVAIAESPLDGAPIVISQKPNKSNPGSTAYWQLALEASKRIEAIERS
ncbi:MAG: ParA family protein [Candidatus Poseidoniales archaeon]|nr:MAG: ParA family protein [Candidatus Poseidoniales archaeon]RCH77355.1 MAG: ParA family protein [Candidatus Poseidoniales archaeon]RCH77413.1 MAG: ParA family protein [Candidatus Poseidoniales archaeon]|tara:strand:+ start:1287 stop:2198 length:912 start_codon:yes stop_codon:yes gene_type:complete